MSDPYDGTKLVRRNMTPAIPAEVLDHPIAKEIRGAAPMFAPFLPREVPVEQVVASVYAEIQRLPAIGECSSASIINAASRLCAWGCDIGRTGFLVPYGKVCTPIMGYKGIVEAVLATGAAHMCSAQEVREGDFFEYEYGTEARLKHVPAKTRGAITHAYCVWTVKFGQTTFDVMSVAEIEEIRQRYSKQWKTGPLPSWYARKTIIRRSAKLLPMNAKLAKFFSALHEDEEMEFGKVIVAPTAVDDAPQPVALPEPPPMVTGEQVQTAERLAKNPAWTAREADAIRDKITGMTAQAATDFIERLGSILADRDAEPLTGTAEGDLFRR